MLTELSKLLLIIEHKSNINVLRFHVTDTTHVIKRPLCILYCPIHMQDTIFIEDTEDHQYHGLIESSNTLPQCSGRRGVGEASEYSDGKLAIGDVSDRKICHRRLSNENNYILGLRSKKVCHLEPLQ